jgi:glycosyltransferase involved in cell wall biosynthesis
MQDVVIIPAHNEEKNIGEVIGKVKQYTNNIIVVDDGSEDGTSEKAKQLGVKVLRHSINLGKGAALKTGCDFAYNNGAKQITVIDADGQHDPKEIPRFFESLKNNEIVFGYRKQANSMPFVLKFGNRFINDSLRFLFKIKINDSQCGYRAFKADAYKKIRWSARDYYMETEMIVKAGKHHLKYEQIPIETIYGDKYKGTTVADGLKIVMKMCGWRLLK